MRVMIEIRIGIKSELRRGIGIEFFECNPAIFKICYEFYFYSLRYSEETDESVSKQFVNTSYRKEKLIIIWGLLMRDSFLLLPLQIVFHLAYDRQFSPASSSNCLSSCL